jgi:hypothetical protein
MKTGKIAIQGVISSLLFILFVCQQIVFSGESQLTRGEKRRIQSGAMDTFETIMSLWKRERFDEIYEYGDRISREQLSKETFSSGMKSSYRLASSWETVRDIEPEIGSPKRVYLKALMGFAFPSDCWGDTTFFTKIFEMTLEKDEWRIDLRNLYYGSGCGGFRGWRGPRHARP